MMTPQQKRRSSRASSLLLLLLVVSFVSTSAAAASNDEEEEEATESIECTYYQGNLRYNDNSNREMHLCRIDDFNSTVSTGNYQLPPSLFDDTDDALESGSTRLKLRSLRPNEETGMFEVFGYDPSFEIILSESSLNTATNTTERAAITTSRTVGSRSVLVVRVSSTDAGSPSFDRQELQDNIFGNPSDPDRPSFKTQYDYCSQGQLQFEPAAFGGVTDKGVFDLVVPRALAGRTFDFQVEQWLGQAFISKFGAAANYDHVMFCLPRGMAGEFVAFAVLNDRVSFYSDPWCGMLSATMHEVGHNLGMRHSGEYGGEEYDDESCIMGIGYNSQVGPQKCFNGQKFWAFDWFPDHKKRVNPNIGGEWKGNLAAFVDVSLTTMPIAIRIGDLYLAFNEATKYNKGVNEKRNKVTIVQGNSPKSNSQMLLGLGANEQLTTNAIFSDGTLSIINIEVCDIVEGGAVSYASLSIRLDGTPSSCGITQTAAAPSPSGGCSTGGTICRADEDCCGACVLGSSGYLCKDTISSGIAMAQQGGSRGGAGGKFMRRSLRSGEGVATGNKKVRGINHRLKRF